MVDLSRVTEWTLGKCFDHSVLPKQTTEDDIRAGCREAVAYNCAAFYSASPYWTPVVIEELVGTDVRPATGIGFPFGSQPSKVKALETEMAVAAGCTAVDTVINQGALKSGRMAEFKQDLLDFKAAAGDALTKVILDTCYLTDQEIITACELIAEIGFDYAKTATGQFEGPTMEQFLLMKETLKDTPVKLKVAGVKFPRPQNAYCFLLAGADLIGTRAAVPIIKALGQMRQIGLVPAYQE
ncbi:MAG: deoxyribose-phosphate aldolase [Bifidobacteriaceae bacterium]|jgi:deoxyribose-phosphate aldolase|nr:deoxyribose-phosphate aldolase [Bifidobacteriaceae bacterium]